jgi:hypothetical protein
MRSPCRFEVGLLWLLAGCELDTSPREAAPDAAVSGEPEQRGGARIWVPPDAEEAELLPSRMLRRAAANGGVPKPPLKLELRVDAGNDLPAPEFSVSAVRELRVTSVYTQLTGQHRELRRFFAPSGDLYYEKLVAFSTDIRAPVPFDARVTQPHSHHVAPVAPDARGRVLVSDFFAVAGTWISDRGMTGTWRLDVHLDGARTPSASVKLELVP